MQAMGRGLWVPEERRSRPLTPGAGLLLPERLGTARSSVRQTRPAPIDFMDTFFALDAYLGDSGISGDPEDAVEAVTQEIVSSHDPNVLLAQIAFLNKLSAKPDEARRLIAGYADLLRPDLGANFEDR